MSIPTRGPSTTSLILACLICACGSKDPSGSVDAAPSPDAQACVGSSALGDLTLSVGAALTPSFDPAHHDYTVDLSLLASRVRVTPKSVEPDATVIVQGMPVASGTSSPPIPLALGANAIQVEVTCGVTSSTYVVELTRGASIVDQIIYGKASNTGADDALGMSVSVSGDTMVVGAHQEDSSATGIDGDASDNSAESSGAVYVFRRSGATWVQEAYLKAANTDAGDRFGETVALHGDVLAVGARGEDSGAVGVNGDASDNSVSDSGAVYVFRRSGTSWAQEAYLKASNPGVGNALGFGLALTADTLVTGAMHQGGSGAVYVFRHGTGGWAEEASLKASNPGFQDAFGVSVAVSGDLLAVGAFREDSASSGIGGDQTDDSAESSGAVYVFRRTGRAWQQEAYLKASNPGVADFFGGRVALSDDTLAVGASREDSNATGVGGNQNNDGAVDSGAVYVFRRAGGTWQQEAYVKSPTSAPNTYFGFGVALDGDLLATGATWDLGQGAVFVFRRVAGWEPAAALRAAVPGAGDEFGVSVALSDGILAVGAASEDSNAVGIGGDPTNNLADGSGAFYLFE